MIPTVVQVLMEDYIDYLNSRLPDCIEGVYLHGSIAIQSFEESSDLDFMTVLKRPLTSNQLSNLKEIHEEIARTYVVPTMDGMYVQWTDVGRKEDLNPIPYYNGGVFHEAGYFNQNPVTWWTLKHYGIRIIGPEINKYPIDVTENDLVLYVLDNMNTYWKNRIDRFKKLDFAVIPYTFISEEIKWSVLGVLRQFYTIKEHDIISKMGAGKYALDYFSTKWHKIIKEAIRIREKSNESSYVKNEERAEDAICFLTYILEESNNFVNKY